MAIAVLLLQSFLMALALDRPTYIHPDVFHARLLQRKVQMFDGVNLNYASINELQTLPGVNESVALKIMRLRSQQTLQSLADLNSLAGIEPRQIAQLMVLLDGKVSFTATLRR